MIGVAKTMTRSTVVAPVVWRQARTLTKSLTFPHVGYHYGYWTPGSAGNRKKWTLAIWLNSNYVTLANWRIFSAWQDGTNYAYVYLKDNGAIGIVDTVSPYISSLTAAGVIGATGTWYHLVIRWDSAQASAANRLRCYISGVEKTLTHTYGPGLDQEMCVNGTYVHRTGDMNLSNYGWSGKMAEFCFVDGAALGPERFITDSYHPGIIGVPTWGTLGRYYKFEDNSTAAALYTDSSGNANTTSITNVLTTDQSTNVPT